MDLNWNCQRDGGGVEMGRGVGSLIRKCCVGGSYIFECNINKMRLRIICFQHYLQVTMLKCYYDQKFTSLFPTDFKSVFVWHFTGKILSFEFYPKAVFFECKFRISRSAIVHVQN